MSYRKSQVTVGCFGFGYLTGSIIFGSGIGIDDAIVATICLIIIYALGWVGKE